MGTYLRDPRFAKPRPLHALTPGALQAVEDMRLMGIDRALQRNVASLVTKHGNPPAVLWEGDPVTANARALERLAEAAGFVWQVLIVGPHCIVEGYRLEPQKVGFRAMWSKRSAAGFSWHEPWRYEVREDARPVVVNKITRTGKEGYRPAGVGSLRTVTLGSPWGVRVTWAELQARVRAAGEVSS